MICLICCKCWLLSGIWRVLRFFWQWLVCCDCRSLHDAARNGHRACLDVHIGTFIGKPLPWGLSSLAARHGHIDILKCLQLKRYFWDTLTAPEAAAAGHLACLQFLLLNAATLTTLQYVWHCAASNGQLEVMKWLNVQGHPGIQSAAAAAAYGCQLECLNWALEQCPERSDSVCIQAMSSGSLACLQLACSSGCPLPDLYFCEDQGCLRWTLANFPHVPALPTSSYHEAMAAILTRDVLHRVYERERNEKASTIQKAWLTCYYAPWHPVCKRRLDREFTALCDL